MKADLDAALSVLMQVRPEDRARAEMAEVRQLAAEEQQAQLGGWRDLRTPWVRRIVVAGIGLQLALNVPVWVTLDELFPLRLRGFAMGLSVLCLWLANAVISFAFPSLVDMVGVRGMFLIFAVAGGLSIWFLSKRLPETGHRSLEEPEEDFPAGRF